VAGLEALLAVVFSGFLIGAAARWALPGPDPMPFWFTVLIGYLGSLAASGIAAGLFGAKHIASSPGHVFVTVLLAIGVAAALVVTYRRVIQRRPLTGPDAYRLPSRGLGVARLRLRLRQHGIDPDKLSTLGGRDQPMSADAIAQELERLQDLRDRGDITEEEYKRARERLRRY
jgi:uncharacterized membrane protein YeaQ/YmgE (transglycosylase-associated protein family)